MSENALPESKLRSAPRGSKKGWLTVSGQVPPEIGERFLRLLTERRLQQTDVVCELITEYVERRAA